ncbi:hypothetical protein [Mycoplasmopsis canis]|uniref:hypothetical protein n=1 Tax=Mycoplasmopsis canis TaxID=29555 RepID=UPI001CB79585|nr:hypothetical protein [Mycoplasmopsis canis]
MIERKFKNEHLVAYINPTKNELSLEAKSGSQLLSTYRDNKQPKNKLRPFESILIKL